MLIEESQKTTKHKCTKHSLVCEQEAAQRKLLSSQSSHLEPDRESSGKKLSVVHRLGQLASEIKVHQALPRIQEVKDKAVLRLWDFGGQTEFYTTHHMFLDTGATNIIVMDISKPLTSTLHSEDKELPVGIPNTQEEFLCHWLRSIQPKADDRKKASVILVLTHVDLIPCSARHSFAAAYWKEIQSIISRNQLLPIPADRVYMVDNKCGSEESFKTLRHQLAEVINKQDSWGLPRPITWLKFEADLKEMIDHATAKPAKHIKLYEAKDFVNKYGMNQNDLDACLLFLSEMGDIVWFKDEGLKDVIILDPQWQIDRFKVLITSEQFIKKRHLQDEVFQLLKHGTVTSSTLHKFWAGNDVKFLTELMQKFDLMVPVGSRDEDDGKFLVPCMLPQGEAVITPTEQDISWKPAFSLEYKSSFYQWIPIGTFPKLLVACAKTWSLMDNKYLSSTTAYFEIAAGTILILHQSHGSTLQITIRCHCEQLQRHPFCIILEATRQMSSIMRSYRIQPSQLCQLICPNWRPGDDLFCTVEALQESLSPDSEYSSIQYTEEKCLCHRKQLG